jgi:archaellum component FlaG (FlaF/FlaG flagellin family)
MEDIMKYVIYGMVAAALMYGTMTLGSMVHQSAEGVKKTIEQRNAVLEELLKQPETIRGL